MCASLFCFQTNKPVLDIIVRSSYKNMDTVNNARTWWYFYVFLYTAKFKWSERVAFWFIKFLLWVRVRVDVFNISFLNYSGHQLTFNILPRNTNSLMKIKSIRITSNALFGFHMVKNQRITLVPIRISAHLQFIVHALSALSYIVQTHFRVHSLNIVNNNTVWNELD